MYRGSEYEDDMDRDSPPLSRNNGSHHHHQSHQPQGPGAGCFVTSMDENGRSKLFNELIKEKDTINPNKQPHLYRLISKEILRVANAPDAEHIQEVDLYSDKSINLNVKCYPPTRASLGFNYAGKLIGPKGSYLKALMRETKTRFAILGSGVMKDKDKEDELKSSGDPKYMHLQDDMYFSLNVSASPIDAFERMAYAMACLKRQILSDSREILHLPWIAPVVDGTSRYQASTMDPSISSSKRQVAVSSPTYVSRDSVYAERAYYGREAASLRPVREVEYYDEYGRITRGYEEIPTVSAKGSGSGLGKYRDLANRPVPSSYTRTSAPAASSVSTRTYEYDHSGNPVAYYAESDDRNAWVEGEGRTKPQASTRYVPYRKHAQQ